MTNTETPLKAVKSILISQSAPAEPNSPYHELAGKYNLKIEFRPFIEIAPVGIKEFRKQKINILEHTAVIFTSRNAIDYFFDLCKQSKIEMPATMKYFCVSEQTANYLQKYIQIRKRKVFVGAKTARDLFDYFKKHKTDKYLYPCSSIRKGEIPEHLSKNSIAFTEAIIYDTVSSDLSNLSVKDYDMIAFYSPSGVTSLIQNFPGYIQGDTRIAAFGPTTAQAVRDQNLRLDIEAPRPDAPSMTGAIEVYIKKVNGLK